MSHFPRDIHRRLDAECPCFPGTCRGDVVDGRNVIGQRCKAQKPAEPRPIPFGSAAAEYAAEVFALARISTATVMQAEHAYKKCERDFDAALAALRSWGYDGPPPIDMVLHCPVCGAQHIDTVSPCSSSHCEQGCANPGDCESWSNPPHRSHLCGECGHIWRPADVPTNGVAEIRTKGKKDSPMPDEKGVGKAAEDKKNHANSLYVQAFNGDGKRVVMHSRSTSTAVEDCRIMSSALELAQAVTLRGVQISEANFYDLVIYGRKRQEQPDMAAERLPDEPAEFTAWWAREYAENSKVFHGSRAGYLKAWLAGSSGARKLLNDLHELMGYVEDGSSTVLRLHQDDATKDFIINVGPRQYFGKSIGAAIEQAIKAEKP